MVGIDQETGDVLQRLPAARIALRRLLCVQVGGGSDVTQPQVDARLLSEAAQRQLIGVGGAAFTRSITCWNAASACSSSALGGCSGQAPLHQIHSSAYRGHSSTPDQANTAPVAPVALFGGRQLQHLLEILCGARIVAGESDGTQLIKARGVGQPAY